MNNDDIEMHHAGIGEPHEHSDAPVAPLPLPPLDTLLRVAERHATELIAALESCYDPASAPSVRAWEGIGSEILAHDILLADAAISAKAVLRKLALIPRLAEQGGAA